MSWIKIYHIALREFKIRVVKKSFWVMAFLGPVILGVLMILPLWVTMDTQSGGQTVILNGLDGQSLRGVEEFDFFEIPLTPERSEALLLRYQAIAVVRVSEQGIQYHYTRRNPLLEEFLKLKFSERGEIPTLPFSKHYVALKSQGRAIKETLSYLLAIAVYFFIFLYGVQVMKGVVEEKTNRVIEVLLCTVKPYELMMGKIFGISVVGLSQFLMWIGSVIGLQWVISSYFQFDRFRDAPLDLMSQMDSSSLALDINTYLSVLDELNLPLMLVSYLWFFFFGFLLFAALFAVIGAASDVDTDSQQFIFPITVPLLGSMIFSTKIISEPDSAFANALSMVPFSSPIVFSLRLPFHADIPGFWIWSLLSGAMLFVSFGLTVWIASRIYRIGILSSGSKVRYTDLIKWFFTSQ